MKFALLQAGHYGAPQTRVRFFLFAAKVCILVFSWLNIHWMCWKREARSSQIFRNLRTIFLSQMLSRLKCGGRMYSQYKPWPAQHLHHSLQFKTPSGTCHFSIGDFFFVVFQIFILMGFAGRERSGLRCRVRHRNWIETYRFWKWIGLRVDVGMKDQTRSIAQSLRLHFRHGAARRIPRIYNILPGRYWRMLSIGKLTAACFNWSFWIHWSVIHIPLRPRADYRELPRKLWEYQISNQRSAVARGGFKAGMEISGFIQQLADPVRFLRSSGKRWTFFHDGYKCGAHRETVLGSSPRGHFFFFRYCRHLITPTV